MRTRSGSIVLDFRITAGRLGGTRMAVLLRRQSRRERTVMKRSMCAANYAFRTAGPSVTGARHVRNRRPGFYRRRCGRTAPGPRGAVREARRRESRRRRSDRLQAGSIGVVAGRHPATSFEIVMASAALVRVVIVPTTPIRRTAFASECEARAQSLDDLAG